MRSILLLLIAIFCSICFYGVDLYFLKHNDGFSLHHIDSPLPSNLSWEPTHQPPLPHLSEQRFFYLGKGHQSYVFESADHRYVLKFYRFPSHLRRFSWLKHPFSYHFSKRRQAIKTYNLQKLNLSFASYKIASEQLRDESGILFFHPNPTAHLHTYVLLIDRLGQSYEIDLDHFRFVLQRKGELLFTALNRYIATGDIDSARHLIAETMALVKRRCSLGIGDTDPMLEKNCGWIDETAFYIDVGRFIEDKSLKDPDNARREVARVTQSLRQQLERSAPQLVTFYDRNL